MKPRLGAARSCAGFTFVETFVAMFVVGLVVIALYGGMTSGFSVIRIARENQRATQILVEKMETIRLYNWDQITASSNFIPRTFETYYYSGDRTNTGVLYRGSISINPAPVTEGYSNTLREIVVDIEWTERGLPRQREIRTFVSQYGLQNYVY